MPSQIASPFNLALFVLSTALYFSAASGEATGTKEGGGSAALEGEARKEGSTTPGGKKGEHTDLFCWMFDSGQGALYGSRC